MFGALSGSKRVPINPLKITDFIIVAGGGGGGNAPSFTGSGTNQSGAGGAGGVRYYPSSNNDVSLQINLTRLTVITVGAGGAATTVNGQTGDQGTNSSIQNASITGGIISATGGGGGGRGRAGIPTGEGVGGGSGGGGGYGSANSPYTINAGGPGNAGGYTPPEGYEGSSTTREGGGWKAAGGSGLETGGANPFPITALGVLTGSDYIIARGGPASPLSAAAGAPNTGNGGQGASSGSASGTHHGGAGGKGLVIIRYPDICPPAIVTGSPAIYVSGGYRTYAFTQSGTIIVKL